MRRILALGFILIGMTLTGCSLFQPQEPILLVEAIISIQTFTDELKVVVDGSASRGRNLSYNWDFDDGTTIVDGNAVETHTYAVPGVYTIKLTVVEMRGRIEKIHTTSGTVDLRSNTRPRAVIQVYRTAGDEVATAFYSWEEVLFVGTGSWDPNGSPLSYWWEIGPVDADGNPVDSVYWTENPVVSNKATFKIRLPGPVCGPPTVTLRIAVRLTVQNATFGRDTQVVYITVTGG